MARPKTKTKRYQFVVDDKIDQMIKKIALETDLNATMIFIRAIEDFSTKKGISL